MQKPTFKTSELTQNTTLKSDEKIDEPKLKNPPLNPPKHLAHKFVALYEDVLYLTDTQKLQVFTIFLTP